jgi:hypothetical protein
VNLSPSRTQFSTSSPAVPSGVASSNRSALLRVSPYVDSIFDGKNLGHQLADAHTAGAVVISASRATCWSALERIIS